jgi:hypothetical protein
MDAAVMDSAGAASVDVASLSLVVTVASLSLVVTVATGTLIVNELLSYVQYFRQRSAADNLHKTIVNFFLPSEISYVTPQTIFGGFSVRSTSRHNPFMKPSA